MNKPPTREVPEIFTNLIGKLPGLKKHTHTILLVIYTRYTLFLMIDRYPANKNEMSCLGRLINVHL